MTAYICAASNVTPKRKETTNLEAISANSRNIFHQSSFLLPRRRRKSLLLFIVPCLQFDLTGYICTVYINKQQSKHTSAVSTAVYFHSLPFWIFFFFVPSIFGEWHNGEFHPRFITVSDILLLNFRVDLIDCTVTDQSTIPSLMSEKLLSQWRNCIFQTCPASFWVKGLVSLSAFI